MPDQSSNQTSKHDEHDDERQLWRAVADAGAEQPVEQHVSTSDQSS